MKSFKTMRKEGKGFFTVIAYVVIAFFIIGIFLVGSLTTMLGKDQRNYITVNSYEVLADRWVLEQMLEKTRTVENPSQKQYMIFQMAQSVVNEKVLELEHIRLGLQPSLSGLIEVLKPKYEEAKATYEKEQKQPYPYSLKMFVESNERQFSKDIFYVHVLSGSFVDDVSITREYAFRNTKSQVEYVAIPFTEYMKNITIDNKKIEEAYKQSKEAYLESISSRVISFKKKEEADAFLSKVRADEKNAAKLFEKAQKKTYKIGEFEEFYIVRAAGKGKVSDIFEYPKSTYNVALVEEMNYTPLNQLKPEQIAQLKVQATQGEKEKYLKEFREKYRPILENLKGDFQVEAKKNGLLYGKTKEFSILADEPVKEEKTEKPIEFLDADNQEFFKNSFQKEGTISGVLEWNNTLYRVKVLKITRPVFPIPAEKKDEISKSLAKREQENSLYDFISETHSRYKIKYEWQNIAQLFNIKTGGNQ